nr:hypothetical protein CFP56_01041 [Quercus suber]
MSSVSQLLLLLERPVAYTSGLTLQMKLGRTVSGKSEENLHTVPYLTHVPTKSYNIGLRGERSDHYIAKGCQTAAPVGVDELPELAGVALPLVVVVDEVGDAEPALLEDTTVTSDADAMPALGPVTIEASVLTAPPTTTVVELPTLTRKEFADVLAAATTTVLMPAGRPAGMVATSGCVLTPAASEGCEVTTDGIPVTTPRELVWVRNVVSALEKV